MIHLCIHAKNSGGSTCCTEEEGSGQLQLLWYVVHVIFLGGGEGGGRQCMIIPFTTGHCSLSPKKKYLVFLNQGDQVRHTTNISDARTSTQAYSVRTEVTVRETHWVEIKHANVYIVCKLNLPIYKSKFNSTSNRCSISPCRAPVTCLLF